MDRLELKPSCNTYIVHEPLFRHLDSQYVEEFFDQGSLKLTTYEACRVLEAKETRDEEEGRSWFDFRSPNYGLEAVQWVGMHSYMLCTTTIEAGIGAHTFGTHSSLRIIDVVRFSEAVAAALGDVIAMRVGTCLYTKDRRVDVGAVAADQMERMMANLLGKLAPGISNEEAEAAFVAQQKEMSDLTRNLVAQDPFFVKGSHFESDAEVRIVWDVRRKVEAPIVINCLPATQFCRRS